MIGNKKTLDSINVFPPLEDQDGQTDVSYLDRYQGFLEVAIENYGKLSDQIEQHGLISHEDLSIRHEKLMAAIHEEDNPVRKITLIFMENDRLRKLLPQEDGL